MTEYTTEKCRVCLTTNIDDYISDCSSYIKFFIQFFTLKKSIENLWLCVWCKETLKKVISFFTLATESEKIIQNEINPSLRSYKRVYNLKYVNTLCIDIPPNEQNDKEETIDSDIIKSEEFENPVHEEYHEIEIPIKRRKNKNKMSEHSNSTDKNNLKADMEIKKNNKNDFNFSQLNFEVEFLSLEEQIKEVESTRLKYKESAFQCSECGRGFVTSTIFEEHKTKHSEMQMSKKMRKFRNYGCGCEYSQHPCFKSSEVLSQHALAHRRRFKCMLCGVVFKRWQHCVQHRYKCGGIVEPVACEICLKIFDNEHLLKMHMKIHRRERKYSCDQCGRKFVSKTSLTVHIRSHSGDKPYSCKVCSRSFTTSSNLHAHLSVHNNETNHYCVECHTYYKTAKSLKRHFNESARHVMDRKEIYLCKECHKRFPTEKLLKQHINTRHTREHRCELCHKTFSNNSNLNKHIKCVHTT